MSAYHLDVLTFLLRWLHVVAAIAWIGESFYFVALDRGLKRPKDAPANALGEMWSVHGGGFYHKQKYLLLPAHMPDDLHWSKWKSYTTWMSGFALLSILHQATANRISACGLGMVVATALQSSTATALLPQRPPVNSARQSRPHQPQAAQPEKGARYAARGQLIRKDRRHAEHDSTGDEKPASQPLS